MLPGKISVVAERIVDEGILHLIKQWLKAPVIGEDERGVKKNVGGGKSNREGTPQGGVISPLLANCYLRLAKPPSWLAGSQTHRIKKLFGL